MDNTVKDILVRRLVENRNMSYLGATVVVNRVIDEKDVSFPEAEWVLEELKGFWEGTIRPVLAMLGCEE